MPRSIVEFQHVSKVYRAVTAGAKLCPCPPRDVTLTVARGSVFGLIGPNRAGKTTLVKTLLSICRPTSGTVPANGPSRP